MEKVIPIEDPDYDYKHSVPTERMLSHARALLEIPGQFSVQMLADHMNVAHMAAMSDARRLPLSDQMDGLSIAMVNHIQALCAKQYMMGAEYACHCLDVKVFDPDTLKEIVTPKPAREFRAMLKEGAKSPDEAQNSQKDG